jgi:hypothetical protein
VESADISPEIVLTPNGDIKDLQAQDVIEMEDGTTETTEDPATNKKKNRRRPCQDMHGFNLTKKNIYADVLFFLSHIFFPF